LGALGCAGANTEINIFGASRAYSLEGRNKTCPWNFCIHITTQWTQKSLGENAL